MYARVKFDKSKLRADYVIAPEPVEKGKGSTLDKGHEANIQLDPYLERYLQKLGYHPTWDTPPAPRSLICCVLCSITQRMVAFLRSVTETLVRVRE
jgi:hypothetical protein